MFAPWIRMSAPWIRIVLLALLGPLPLTISSENGSTMNAG
jgi:hypothetical protein